MHTIPVALLISLVLGAPLTLPDADIGNATSNITHDTGSVTDLAAPDVRNVTTYTGPIGGDAATLKVRDSGNATTYDTSFDDLKPGALPIAGTEGEIGPYNGLEFKSIGVIDNGVGGTVVAGVRSSSPPNVAVYSSLNAGTINGEGTNPRITTQYIGSVGDTFDFKSFYYGCVSNLQESVGTAPTACKVTVTGYKATKPVARQEFRFGPPLLSVVAGMESGVLQGFNGIDTAVFETDTDNTLLMSSGGLAVATLLDNLVYTTYNADQPVVVPV
ncbi:hypothetical protein LTR05_001982 [Lithohypha guttulata]|uniref:Uncharacterized protein n=1 Tax=Lithohypha guttulata TaxID=1690604 RepID=A0AAN7T2T1_9EURO|nr:hypothetical protein LTR05_001982 [Lithohypha guttulata]